VSERGTGRILSYREGRIQEAGVLPEVRPGGEGGLLGLAVGPGFTQNRWVYAYLTTETDNRVVRMPFDGTSVGPREVLLEGIPRARNHNGGRLAVGPDGMLYIGTGDAAVGTNPRNLRSLGGKTLRLDRLTGAPWPSNPYAAAAGPRRYVHTYGHRNVQGVTERADGTLWNVEQGTDRDDEVNLLVNGGDYGYNPVPGYNESVPMTDQSLPGHQVKARWRSGDPTLATSGGSFVNGAKWGALNGALAVACLKASRVVLLTFDAKGKLLKARQPKALRQFGRIRQVSTSQNGDLLVTTDNGGGNDVILRVSPR
jgi:glucose/arabinose dehydrogenase